MDVIIKPKLLEGNINIPPSKSLAHRAIIAASLANGRSIITNVDFSKDIIATIDAMRALGAIIDINGDTLTIEGSYPKRVKQSINAKESGSTLRFLIPISMLADDKITFKGENNLVNRPLDVYTNIFDEKNIKYSSKEKALPLTIYDKLVSGEYRFRGDISSQFITGLLYALPLLKSDSKIILTTPLESIGYVDLTIDILAKFGVKIINNGYSEFIIKGNQEYKPYNYEVEGDYSQAAFFLVADALGSNIKVNGLNLSSIQGDKKILNDLMSFGLTVNKTSNEISVDGKPKGTKISFKHSPDLAPALSVLASLSQGESLFTDAERLRIKESDRISSMINELSILGANVTEALDTMAFLGVDYFKGGVVDSHNDHRIAMSLAIASTRAIGDIRITNAECVSKSDPNFWEDFKSLGGDISYEES